MNRKEKKRLRRRTLRPHYTWTSKRLHTWRSVDYSAIEARVMLHYADHDMAEASQLSFGALYGTITGRISHSEPHFREVDPRGRIGRTRFTLLSG